MALPNQLYEIHEVSASPLWDATIPGSDRIDIVWKSLNDIIKKICVEVSSITVHEARVRAGSDSFKLPAFDARSQGNAKCRECIRSASPPSINQVVSTTKQMQKLSPATPSRLTPYTSSLCRPS
jgi:hypothetical protein